MRKYELSENQNECIVRILLNDLQRLIDKFLDNIEQDELDNVIDNILKNSGENNLERAAEFTTILNEIYKLKNTI